MREMSALLYNGAPITVIRNVWLAVPATMVFPPRARFVPETAKNAACLRPAVYPLKNAKCAFIAVVEFNWCMAEHEFTAENRAVPVEVPSTVKLTLKLPPVVVVAVPVHIIRSRTCVTPL